MAYIVTTNIIDTKDNNRFYEKGTDARIKALLKKGVIESNGEAGDVILPTDEPVEEVEAGE